MGRTSFALFMSVFSPMYACMGSRIISRAPVCRIALSMRSSERGKPLLALINDKNTVKVCFGFHKAGLDGVAQTVLGGLVNHIEWLMRCHVGERLAVGTSGGKA